MQKKLVDRITTLFWVECGMSESVEVEKFLTGLETSDRPNRFSDPSPLQASDLIAPVVNLNYKDIAELLTRELGDIAFRSRHLNCAKYVDEGLIRTTLEGVLQSFKTGEIKGEIGREFFRRIHKKLNHSLEDHVRCIQNRYLFSLLWPSRGARYRLDLELPRIACLTDLFANGIGFDPNPSLFSPPSHFHRPMTFLVSQLYQQMTNWRFAEARQLAALWAFVFAPNPHVPERILDSLKRVLVTDRQVLKVWKQGDEWNFRDNPCWAARPYRSGQEKVDCSSTCLFRVMDDVAYHLKSALEKDVVVTRAALEKRCGLSARKAKIAFALLDTINVHCTPGTVLKRVDLKRWLAYKTRNATPPRKALSVDSISNYLKLLQRFGLLEYETQSGREIGGTVIKSFVHTRIRRNPWGL